MTIADEAAIGNSCRDEGFTVADEKGARLLRWRRAACFDGRVSGTDFAFNRREGFTNKPNPKEGRPQPESRHIMLTALVLVCSLTLTPDLSSCDQSNALDVIRIAEEFGSPGSCLMHGQAYLAQTEIGRQLGTDERVKIACSRTSKIVSRARPTSVQ